MWICIDPRGRVTAADAYWHTHPEFECMPASSRREYLVKNMGFGLVSKARSGVRVVMRLSIMSETCFAAVLFSLADLATGRVAISDYNGGWEHKVFPGLQSAIGYLATKRAERFVAVEDDFEEEFLPLEQSLACGYLAEFLRSYSNEPDRVLDASFLGEMERHGQRYGIVKYDAATDLLAFEALRGNYCIIGNEKANQVKGVLFQDQPNVRYAMRAQQTYYRAVCTKAPVYSEIRTTLQCQKTQRPTRFKYRRLIMPVPSTSGETRLVCASVEIERRAVGGAF